MRLVYPSAKAFYRIIEGVAALITEGALKIDTDGVKMIAMDPSQISMVSLRIKKDAFLEYDIPNPMTLGLDIDYLKKVLKRARSDELLELTVEEGKLRLTLGKEKRKRTFYIPLLDLTESMLKEPNIEYHNYVQIDAEALKEIVKDAELIATYIKFIIDQDGVQAIATGETSKFEGRYEKGEEVLDVNAETGAKGLYPIEYLSDMIKVLKKGEIITLYIETDKPLKLEFNLEGAEFKYYLAPASEE
jgi:proliferating cell nuclear antigen